MKLDERSAEEPLVVAAHGALARIALVDDHDARGAGRAEVAGTVHRPGGEAVDAFGDAGYQVLVAEGVRTTRIVHGVAQREGAIPFDIPGLGIVTTAVLILAVGIVAAGYWSDAANPRRVLMAGCVGTIVVGVWLIWTAEQALTQFRGGELGQQRREQDRRVHFTARHEQKGVRACSAAGVALSAG